MFLIANTPRDYSWGSATAIANLLGRIPSGHPEAELWLGDHPGSPAHRVDTGQSLGEWGAENPDRYGTRPLPFLVKVLAAEKPLSIQAHPNRDQAIRGFARENAEGIALDAPNRNYRDPNHKPEIIIALTDFSALCGFRPRADRERILGALEKIGVPGVEALRSKLEEGLGSAVEWILTRGDGVDALVGAVSIARSTTGDDLVDDAMTTAAGLADSYPGDPGVAVSLLLNHVVLSPGEALFLPAGNIHAYLHGLGIEVMAASDNVLRGGLTSKHIDVDELLDVLDSRELAEPRIVSRVDGTVRTFAPDGSDFVVTDADVAGVATVAVPGPAIAIVIDGAVTVHAAHTVDAGRGQAVFVEAGETVSSLSGKGRIFLAHCP